MRCIRLLFISVVNCRRPRSYFENIRSICLPEGKKIECEGIVDDVLWCINDKNINFQFLRVIVIEEYITLKCAKHMGGSPGDVN